MRLHTILSTFAIPQTGELCFALCSTIAAESGKVQAYNKACGEYITAQASQSTHAFPVQDAVPSVDFALLRPVPLCPTPNGESHTGHRRREATGRQCVCKLASVWNGPGQHRLQSLSVHQQCCPGQSQRPPDNQLYPLH